MRVFFDVDLVAEGGYDHVVTEGSLEDVLELTERGVDLHESVVKLFRARSAVLLSATFVSVKVVVAVVRRLAVVIVLLVLFRVVGFQAEEVEFVVRDADCRFVDAKLARVSVVEVRRVLSPSNALYFKELLEERSEYFTYSFAAELLEFSSVLFFESEDVLDLLWKRECVVAH